MEWDETLLSELAEDEWEFDECTDDVPKLSPAEPKDDRGDPSDFRLLNMSNPLHVCAPVERERINRVFRL